jgi:hypothetical protein
MNELKSFSIIIIDRRKNRNHERNYFLSSFVSNQPATVIKPPKKPKRFIFLARFDFFRNIPPVSSVSRPPVSFDIDIDHTNRTGCAMPCHAMPCHATPRHATPRHEHNNNNNNNTLSRRKNYSGSINLPPLIIKIFHRTLGFFRVDFRRFFLARTRTRKINPSKPSKTD